MKDIPFAVALVFFSFAVSATEQSATRVPVSVTTATVVAPYHEIRLRHRPEEATLRDMRKMLEKTGKVFIEERPDGGVNLIVLK